MLASATATFQMDARAVGGNQLVSRKHVLHRAFGEVAPEELDVPLHIDVSALQRFGRKCDDDAASELLAKPVLRPLELLAEPVLQPLVAPPAAAADSPSSGPLQLEVGAQQRFGRRHDTDSDFTLAAPSAAPSVSSAPPATAGEPLAADSFFQLAMAAAQESVDTLPEPQASAEADVPTPAPAAADVPTPAPILAAEAPSTSIAQVVGSSSSSSSSETFSTSSRASTTHRLSMRSPVASFIELSDSESSLTTTSRAHSLGDGLSPSSGSSLSSTSKIGSASSTASTSPMSASSSTGASAGAASVTVTTTILPFSPPADAPGGLEAVLYPQLPQIAKLERARPGGLGFGEAAGAKSATEQGALASMYQVERDASLQEVRAGRFEDSPWYRGVPEQLDEAGKQAAAKPAAAPLVSSPAASSGMSLVEDTHVSLGAALFGLVTVLLVVGFACLAAGFVTAGLLLPWQKSSSGPRAHVERMPRCQAADIDMHLPDSGGYDCMFSKPVSSRQLLRLEIRVERPPVPLTAPLTGKPCVLYSAAVTRHIHGGMHPAPVAYDSASTSFMVSLVDAPHVQIEREGVDVSLFDMCEGSHVVRQPLAEAPEPWQDFVIMHRVAAPAAGGLRRNAGRPADGSVLEFQEYALQVGAVATVVGELQRGPDGAFSMRPLHSDGAAPGAGLPSHASWSTSWEQIACGAAAQTTAAQAIASTQSEKVASEELADSAIDKALSSKILASDDPSLMTPGSPKGRVRSQLQELRRSLRWRSD